MVGFVEALGDLLIGRPRRARAAIGSWFSNLVHVRRLRASRQAGAGRCARARLASCASCRCRAPPGSARSSPTTSTPTPGCASLGDASRSAVDSVSDGMRTPAAIAFLGFLVLVVLGSRDADHPRASRRSARSAHWPGVGDVFDSFGSAWRYTGLGSASPAPAALALIGAMGTVLLGAVGLAQTLTVVVAIPLGAFGAYRLGRHVIGLRGPALAAGLAYGINPVARNAIAQGRLGPLVLFALLPFLLLRDRPARRAQRRRARRVACCGSRCSPRCSARCTRPGSASSCSRLLAFVLAIPIAGRGRATLRGVRHRDRRVRSARWCCSSRGRSRTCT